MDVHPLYRQQKGVSLIESMVALVVLSIGMLGVGSLVLHSLQDTRGSINRTKATVLAWDMLERMRANTVSATAYLGDWDATGTNNDCVTTDTSVANSCTPADLAADDVFRWRAAVADPTTGIPGGRGNITQDTTTIPPVYQVQVRWVDGIVNGVENLQIVTVQTML